MRRLIRETRQQWRGVMPTPWLLIALLLPAVADAQDTRPFLALDLAGGYATTDALAADASPTDPPPSLRGFAVDGALRVAHPWFGVVGSIWHVAEDAVSVNHYLTGVRVSTPFGTEFGQRVFAHALTGIATASGHRSLVVGAGAGWDFAAVGRLQVEWTRQDLPGVPRDAVHGFIGGVVPLCFRACRDRDGWNLSGRPGR
jgi:hypothetical protein